MDHVTVLWGVVGIIAVYQLWVSVRVSHAAHLEASQKLLQVALVWLVPVIGAIIVHSMLAVEGKTPHKPEKGYTEPIGSGGSDQGT